MKKIKIRPVWLLDVLSFSNRAKQRKKRIEKTKEAPVRADYSINRLAGELHPEQLCLVVRDCVSFEEAQGTLFTLSRKGGGPLPVFEAGQYLTFTFAIGESLLSRSYSICSSPREAREGFYRIYVREGPDSFAAGWIRKNWKSGAELKAHGPNGTFTMRPLRDEKQILALAGGSGITPFVSMAKAIRDGLADFCLTILYGARTAAQMPFLGKLREISEKCPLIRVVPVLSDVRDHDAPDGFETGWIGEDMVRKYMPQGPFSLFFCGPRPMYELACQTAGALGLKRKNLRYESFGLSSDDKANGNGSCRVRVLLPDGEELELVAQRNESLLVAFERGGIAVRSGCRSGSCGFCRCRVLQGEYQIQESEKARRRADSEHSYVHTCVCFPRTDLCVALD